MARIQISKDPSGRIIVSFPYDPLLVSKVKTIEGRRWHRGERHWSFPNSEGTLEKILKLFEEKEVQIDPCLQAKFPTLKGSVSHFVVSAQSSDLWTDNHSIPTLEKGGERGFESALFPKLSASSKTTEIYTHVSTQSIGKIRSPLDSLDLNQGGDK